MDRRVTAGNLFEDLEKRLQLQWVCGGQQADAPVLSSDALTVRPAVAGFLNLIHPNKVQVLGREELVYLDALDDAETESTLSSIFQSRPLAVVVSDGLEIPPRLASHAKGSATALFRSKLPSQELVGYLQYHISRTLAQSTTLHGVFMEMFTIGVLITGDAGSGKSELALELLTRGHRLIADDVPEFTQISPEIIDGTCPEVLQDCLEVRGLGVLNVRHMFGDSAIKQNKFLRLIIHLDVPGEGDDAVFTDRLRGESSLMPVLGLNIPRIILPVLAGRNLAVIAEAAVRDFMLKMKGYDAASEFIERHSRLLQKQGEEGGH